MLYDLKIEIGIKADVFNGKNRLINEFRMNKYKISSMSVSLSTKIQSIECNNFHTFLLYCKLTTFCEVRGSNTTEMPEINTREQSDKDASTK